MSCVELTLAKVCDRAYVKRIVSKTVAAANDNVRYLKTGVAMCAVCATISHGIFALFGFSNETTRSAVDAFTRTFHMPYVTVSAPVNDSLATLGGDEGSTDAHRSAATSEFTVHLRPLFDRATLDLIRHYRWRNISYVYDSNDGELQSCFQ